MSTRQPNAGSQKLINEIQLARLKLAQAESKWELADEQAREARRRRKEAKQAARRAKKAARQAKEEFAAAKEAVVALEGKFAAAVEHVARQRKLARARRAAKTGAAEARTRISPPPHATIPPAAPKVEIPVLSLPATGSPPSENFPDSEPATRRGDLMKKATACRTLPARAKARAAVAAAGPEPPAVVLRDPKLPEPVTMAILPAGQPPSGSEPHSASRI
ncbi:MAG TPA: hypothetical protein VMB80_01570 [Candidatus Acidoferrum sp.]|nr:hypothetical protein [Candidatus Acidoferrum sp.]